MKVMKLLTILIRIFFALPLYAQLDPELLKKAETGDAQAQYDVGYIYANGLNGVIKNTNKAFEWYSKSAEQGNGIAQYRLGYMYSNGQGVL
jgi:TPR repeat protein